MERRLKLVSIILVSMLLLSLAIYTTYRTYTDKTIHLKIILGKNGVSDGLTAYLKLTASYDIKVYRHGQLVAERNKDNDPISINWYKAVANLLLLGTDSGKLFTWYDTGYNARLGIDTENYFYWDGNAGRYVASPSNPIMKIALGNGTGTPSLNDYKLFSQVMIEKAEMTVQDDTVNSRFIVTYTKTFLVKQQFTLTEVGMILSVRLDYGLWVDLLFCHDLVQPSITLYPNDTVSVTYRVEIPYNNAGVFTEWFYNALIDYMLGYKGTTGNSLTLKFASGSTGVIDSGTDYFPTNTAHPFSSVSDYVHVDVGTGRSTANPLWEVYGLANSVAGTPITDTAHFMVVKNTSGNLTITYIVAYTFTSAENISEIGLFLHTDRDGGSRASADDLLLAYWVLANPVQVQAYSGLRVEITITIPYS